MISTEQRNALDAKKPSKYLKLVVDYLTEKRIVSPNGKPYKASAVSNVYNGTRSNAAIEDAIIYVFDREEKKRIEKDNQRNKKLGIKKTA